MLESRRDHRSALLIVAALLMLAAITPGCADDPVDRLPLAEAQVFTPAAMHEGAAFLSAGGTGADDVWLVGAQPAPNTSATVLHFDGTEWSTLDTGVRHTLWWIHAFENGPVFAAGGGASVVRIEDGTVERLETPVFFGNTIFGLWGATPDDLWAVGGFAGRAGFIWHWDGATWTDSPLPEDFPRNQDGEVPALFKVWGRNADDVWAVGGAGSVVHWDGSAWSVVESGTTEQLFTVTGDEDDVIIVGGSGTGVLLRGGLDGFVDEGPALEAPLLQGATVDGDGTLWVAGATGFAARLVRGQDWERVDLNLESTPQSIHALWSDGAGHIWAVGGGVLSPALEAGVACASVDVPTVWVPTTVTQPTPACPAAAIDPMPDGSMARRWNEQLLNSIRRDIPHPPKHARNLLHVSIAMFDAWAAYNDPAVGVVFDEDQTAESQEDVEIAVSYAALRVLPHRYETAVGGAVSLDCYDQFMDVLGLDPSDQHTEGNDPIAVGNRIGYGVVDHFANDGANEANGYADTTGWSPANPVMIVDRLGTNVTQPDVWQQLNLGTAETQNGIVLETSVQPYIGAHWREVEPFAIERDSETGLYGDAMGPYPSVTDDDAADWVVQMIRQEAELGIEDGVTWDIGPRGRGNNSLGANDGEGYDVNPVTGNAYEPNVVPRGDFTRVVAEFWADGPTSETPPGHWAVLANEISDELPPDELVPFGVGEPV
ncbi:MAG: hypothetical protein KC561_12145, partial [Myxococcales bacterium]|nr:hypothetical protein [Myxococcales bacterium]